MKLIKADIRTKIQLTAEVNGALVNNDVVVIKKHTDAQNRDQHTYDVYGSTGKIDGGKLIEE